MQVKTQPSKDAIELKGDGISFDVYGNGSKRLGDLCITKAGLIWSKGSSARAPRDGGINVKWEEFIAWVQSRRAESAKSARPSAQGIAAMKSAALKLKQAGQGTKISSSRAVAPKTASETAKSSVDTKPASLAKASLSGKSTRTEKSTVSGKSALNGKSLLNGKSPLNVKPASTRSGATKPISEAGRHAAKRASAMKLAASVTAAATKATGGKVALKAGKASSKSAADNATSAPAVKPALVKQAKGKTPAPLATKPADAASKATASARRKTN